MDYRNHSQNRERILLEFLSAYEHGGMQRIFFCAGVKQRQENTDEE
ncbi:MAG: hypothetical protein ACK4WD_00590 [Flavobacteriales bacterium]|jgi:hypothetical protein